MKENFIGERNKIIKIFGRVNTTKKKAIEMLNVKKDERSEEEQPVDRKPNKEMKWEERGEEGN